MNALSIPAGFIALSGMIISYKNSQKIIYPGVIFNFIWFFAIVMNQVNLNGFYHVNENTYAIIVTGLIFFNIPFLMAKNLQYQPLTVSKMYVNPKSNYILLIMQLLMTATLVHLCLKAMPFYAMYGTSGFRTILANSIEYGYMNAAYRIFYLHFGILPLCLVVTGIQILLWTNGKSTFWRIIPGLINELLIVYATGSRGNFLIILIFFIEAVMLSKSKKDTFSLIYKKIKRKTKWMVLLIIVALMVISVLRGNVGTGNFLIEFLKTISLNFSGGINLLDLAVNSPDEWGLYDYKYGLAVFNGFLQIGSFLLRIISLGTVNIIVPSVTEYASNFFYVSSTQRMNAYVTVFYTFIQDLGIAGLVLYSALTSFISISLYKSSLRKPNIMTHMYFMMFTVILLFSTIRWRLMLTDWASMFLHTFWVSWIVMGKKFPIKFTIGRKL